MSWLTVFVPGTFLKFDDPHLMQQAGDCSLRCVISGSPTSRLRIRLKVADAGATGCDHVANRNVAMMVVTARLLGPFDGCATGRNFVWLAAGPVVRDQPMI